MMRRVLKLFAVNLGLLLGGLLVAELIFGGWLFHENYGTLVIPKNFKRHFDVSRLYDGGKIFYIRDEHGLRGGYESPDKIDIVAIGGSTTNEIFVDETETWTAVLADAFSKDSRKISVVNAGVDGQSTIGSLKNFELWFPKITGFKPRFFLAYLGINDFAVAMQIGPDAPHRISLSKQDCMLDERRPVKQYLMNNSALYALFRNIRGMIRARDAKVIHSGRSHSGTDWRPAEPQPNIDAAERLWSNRLDEYAQRLRKFVERVQAMGAKPIFVTQHRPGYRVRDGIVHGRYDSTKGSVDTDNYAGLMALNRRTIAICREVGGICVDLANELFFVDDDHYDEVHTTPTGSRKIGVYLHAKLKDVIR